jgi:hypothetical protein
MCALFFYLGFLSGQKIEIFRVLIRDVSHCYFIKRIKSSCKMLLYFSCELIRLLLDFQHSLYTYICLMRKWFTSVYIFSIWCVDNKFSSPFSITISGRIVIRSKWFYFVQNSIFKSLFFVAFVKHT